MVFICRLKQFQNTCVGTAVLQISDIMSRPDAPTVSVVYSPSVKSWEEFRNSYLGITITCPS